MASLARFWNSEKSVKLFRIWWTRGDSNPRPPRCERGALPAELLAHEQRGNSSKRSGACQHAFRCLQTHKDASRFPTGQDAVTLTSKRKSVRCPYGRSIELPARCATIFLAF